ncbi:Crp/Fnr family transcriptional regulator [Thioclava sp. BHET1]|nr:Crp/Fnr family transcriptional regulator [Thioclava sp. BHET1]
MTPNWIEAFPALSALSPALRRALLEGASIVEVPQGTIVFAAGMAAESLFLLLSGQVRVHQTSESGREIVLYRVSAGDSCVMTTACMLAHEDYSAEGVAETDLQVVAIPAALFDRLIAQSAEFRSFVLGAYASRITELFQIIEEIAFQRLDIRLAQKLGELASGDRIVRVTHQTLAMELGTAREVVSRQLQEFQRRDWIAQTRGAVELLRPEALSALARSGG